MEKEGKKDQGNCLITLSCENPETKLMLCLANPAISVGSHIKCVLNDTNKTKGNIYSKETVTMDC